ncbi:methylated-DNA--[protein]-cysteine S-methyltransferase [Agaribacter flavus]|uniref:Methylated-DNA--protein-cysteine methyltransferase n=1 Tax=Agaribacter flavus TaxID=1902781 RepID=A0ABV7FTK5_9ALTE
MSKAVTTHDTHFVSELTTDIGFVRILATEHAVHSVRFYSEQTSVNENAISRMAKEQIGAYFSGKLQRFDLPLAPQGTVFQQNVWRQLLTVPFGKVVSYLDIATQLDKPSACRAVGAANGKNPISIIIPCHRVIGSSGKLTGYAGGLHRKSFLLGLEGAEFALQAP